MTPSDSINIEEILELAAVRADDRVETRALLESAPSAEVEAALAVLRSRLGNFGEKPPSSAGGQLVWMSALLRFLPEQLSWYRDRGIPEEVIRATVADIGRHIAISRVTTGFFGLETWRWLTEHATGTLYQLGRLQFQIQPGPEGIADLASNEAVLGIHIPEEEGRPLSPAAVEDSLARAVPFFAEFFPRQPVRLANCVSWLLDPYLLETLPPQSNIAQFASRFTLYGELLDTPSDAVYFTFRRRDVQNIAALPRDTALQRTVLGRIENGGSWQVGQGYLQLSF
ncbi:hypothetical protein FHU41_000778 [Psychromicrobium silvestre]|uniref:Acyltransferase n=1 Tax=Psychromicrobium silvestre TaxID=1645614 RepID=A0A7Y9LS23_9MICC|nr:acyltransferase domain-containing protein [Psychromicrobium silvestre]NYE94557.1 hypothetical protein [Psychromicrobium silvestre]